MTKTQFNALLDSKKDKKKNKFGAQKTEYNGRVFDSKKEARRAFELEAMRRAGEVVKIDYQPRYDIIVNGKNIGYYKADFRVTYSDGRIEIEDVKGLKKGSAYSVFRIKKKLVEALYDVKIVEI